MATADDVVGPVNLGNPEELTMLELADQVIEATGSRSRKVFSSLPADDPTRRRPDISLARKELGWSPAKPLVAGLAATVSYFDRLLRDGVRTAHVAE